MSFEGEFASYEPLRRIIESQRINKRLQELHVKEVSPSANSISQNYLVAKSSLTQIGQQPDLVLAIDGSYQAAPVKNGFPCAECGYVTVASVLLDLKKAKELEKDEFIDPKRFRETEKSSSFEAVFPGCNIIVGNEPDAKSSLRKVLFEEMKNCHIFEDGETLLDTYEALLRIKLERSSGVRPPMSPIEGNEHEMTYGYGVYECPQTHLPLYSTDALRLHELMNPSSTCGEMYGQIMSAIEKLWLIHILRSFEKNKWLATLRRVAFVIDGPLAVFSTASWLTNAIKEEIKRINDEQKKINGTDMMIIGLEKSGTFFNHFNSIDTDSNGVSGKFPIQNAFLLTDEYIKKNIIYSDSTKPFGQDTYFGRKFFYKAKSGQLLVPVDVCYTDYQFNLNTANPNQFSRLADAMELLDHMASSRYPNSVTPLISAHAEAAIPLNLGRKLFESIANDIINQNNND